jgi:hypothetical protein
MRRVLPTHPIDHLRIRVQPTRTVRTAVVCLPSGTAPVDMPSSAAAALTAVGLPSVGVLPHFAVNVRHRPWRVRNLVDCWKGLTSGGPVRLLDLAGMRAAAAASADVEWQVWNQLVRGTKPAEPFWVFLNRFRDHPARYPLARAQAEYRSQPRIMAMAAHNAAARSTSGSVPALPTSAVEVFQAGHYTYVATARLAAVPGDAVRSVTGMWMTSASGRLADTLAFLTAANAHLDELPPNSTLVAVASPVRDGGVR